MVVFEIELLEVKIGKPSQSPRGRDSGPGSLGWNGRAAGSRTGDRISLIGS